jgi:hypothetical protein
MPPVAVDEDSCSSGASCSRGSIRAQPLLDLNEFEDDDEMATQVAPLVARAVALGDDEATSPWTGEGAAPPMGQAAAVLPGAAADPFYSFFTGCSWCGEGKGEMA